jgi:hypothetical protein
VFFRCLKTEDGYAEIVRWNRKIRDFTSLAKLTGPQYGVEDGDVIGRASPRRHQGLRQRRGKSPPPTTSSARRARGQVSFFVSDTSVDHGFRYFEVDTYGG